MHLHFRYLPTVINDPNFENYSWCNEVHTWVFVGCVCWQGSRHQITAILEAHHHVKQSFFWSILLCDFRTKYDIVKSRVYTPESLLPILSRESAFCLHHLFFYLYFLPNILQGYFVSSTRFFFIDQKSDPRLSPFFHPKKNVQRRIFLCMERSMIFDDFWRLPRIGNPEILISNLQDGPAMAPEPIVVSEIITAISRVKRLMAEILHQLIW